MKVKTPLGVVLFLFLLCFELLFTSHALHAQVMKKYPNVDVDGYKKWEYRDPSVTPNTQFFSGITHLGYYPTLTGGKIQERLQLKIQGEFSDDISLSAEIEQQPELPDQYKIRARNGPTEVLFGNINASFTGNEFASASKFIDGMLVQGKTDWYEFQLVPNSKLRSNTQKVSTLAGNNTPGPYSLGHNSIVEGTEKIELNNRVLTKGVDYQIDYFDGKISFTRILTPSDEIRYSYEYTGVLDLFFPVLSKRDFFGAQGRLKFRPDMYTPPPAPAEKQVLMEEEDFTTSPMVLKNTPIVPNTEEVRLGGVILKRGVDYHLDARTGKVEWAGLEKPSVQNNVTVRYEYYKTESKREEIAGKNTKGPYTTAQKPIVPGSMAVKLDRIPLTDGVDYRADSVAGTIEFNMSIDSNSTILLEYNAFQMTPSVPYPKMRGLQPEISTGITYLRESAKSGRVTLNNKRTERFTGAAILDNNRALYLSRFPIVPTTESDSELTMFIAGVGLVIGQDFVFPGVRVDALGNAVSTPEAVRQFVNDPQDTSDGLQTGTIFFFNPIPALGRSLTATDEVQVNYTFRKTTAGRFEGRGNGSRGAYFITGFRSIVPGSDIVQLVLGSGSPRTLRRNSSTTVQDGDYAINYSDPSPSITFNDPIDPAVSFTIMFTHVPNQQIESPQLTHDLFGADAGFSIGDFIQLKSSLASSAVDQLFVEESGTFASPGNGTRRYTLNAPGDVIDGSERVLMNGRYVLNRDVDYFMNYTRPGLLVFFQVTPTSQDAISVEYRYQSTTGIAGRTQKSTGASQTMNWSVKPGSAVRFSGDYKNLQAEFRPLGATGLGSGGSALSNRVEFAPLKELQITADWKDRSDQVGTNRGFLNRQVDQDYSIAIRPPLLGDVDIGYRTLRNLDNALELPGRPFAQTADSLAQYYTFRFQTAQLRKGILSLRNGVKITRTDTRNTLSSLFQRNELSSVTSEFGLTERFGLNFDYQVNEPFSQNTLTNAITSHRRATDFNYGLKSDFTIAPIQKLAGQLRFTDHNENDVDVVSTAPPVTTRNANYTFDFIPVTPLALNVNHNRQEQISVVGGSQNPVSERTLWSGRYSPLNTLALNYKASAENSVQASGATSAGNSDGFGVNYNVLNLSFLKSTLRFDADNRKTEVLPSTPNPVVNRTNTVTQDSGIVLTFIPFGLITLNGDIGLQNYRNITSTATTETQNITGKISTALQPFPTLELSGALSYKRTRDQLTSVTSPKSVFEGQATYRLSTWGNLAVQVQNETNRGEVQGGRLTGLDFIKNTRTATFTFIIPSDNALVSRGEGKVSYRNVSYFDNPGGANRFDAVLLTGEFTLSF